jgi:hypothetical protein
VFNAGAVNHFERTEKTPVFIPLTAGAVQQTVGVAEFLRQLTVSMPDAT